MFRASSLFCGHQTLDQRIDREGHQLGYEQRPRGMKPRRSLGPQKPSLRDPALLHSTILSMRFCSHATRWLPHLQASHTPSRQKKRGKTKGHWCLKPSLSLLSRKSIASLEASHGIFDCYLIDPSHHATSPNRKGA